MISVEADKFKITLELLEADQVNDVVRSSSIEYSYGDYFDSHFCNVVVIRIYNLQQQLIRSATLQSNGGGTGLYEKSFLLDSGKIIICIGHSLFCLTVPFLDLDWKVAADPATCFAVYKYQDSYIVHGELEIARVSSKGSIMWSFGGADIFVAPNGNDNFFIEPDRIVAYDWNKKKI